LVAPPIAHEVAFCGGRRKVIGLPELPFPLLRGHLFRHVVQAPDVRREGWEGLETRPPTRRG
jgi:hypothetical protein